MELGLSDFIFTVLSTPLYLPVLIAQVQGELFVVSIPETTMRWGCCSKKSVFLSVPMCPFSLNLFLCLSLLASLYFSLFSTLLLLSSPSLSLVYYGTDIFIF